MNDPPKISAMTTRTAKTISAFFISSPPRTSDFSRLFSSRAAIPASENDGRAHAKLSPALSGTRRTPEQCPHEIPRSRADAKAVQTPTIPRPSPPLRARRLPLRAPAVLLQRPSAYGEAVSARQKKIFAAQVPVRARFLAREGNAAAISKVPSACRVRFAAGADSSAPQSSQRDLLRTKRGVLASCPEFRWQKRPRLAAT